MTRLLECIASLELRAQQCEHFGDTGIFQHYILYRQQEIRPPAGTNGEVVELLHFPRPVRDGVDS